MVRGKLAAAGAGAVLAAAALTACGANNASSPGGGGGGGGGNLSGRLSGSGSTFQLSFQQAAIQEFKSVQPHMTVDYSGVGSGTGRSNLAAGTTNFAGSDSPIPDSEKGNFHGKKILYFPVLIGPITMSYNLPGVSALKLTPEIIAGLFEGKIKNWNASAIAAANPGVHLPGTPVTLAVRSDSSGTTQNFSLFLQKAAGSAWTLGSDSTIKWPAGAHAGSGNGGVAQVVKSTPGAIGYVDYSDAKAAGLHFASVKNADGRFVAPSTQAASDSASGVSVAPDLTFHAVWGHGAGAYPITYQTWVLTDESQPNAADASMLKAYIGYLLGDGQQLLGQLGYAKLPSSIETKAKAQLDQIHG
ncbi:MAG: phosphate ABC transporter substrate-binding protein PstS [Actinomycetia bacterium]|nr:phosphate ABC transporter substrate-binding protein PstS [Actinomycetes bacterium]